MKQREWARAGLVVAVACGVGEALADGVDLGVMTVTGTREERPKAETPATVDSVSQQEIEFVRPAHPGEVVNEVAGAHVNVTSGEGHTTAIRQPMTTGAVYLYLEDGVPTRSTGFFNHNALYEVNVPQAAGIEVTKGPASALYGSDAIGGVVNVLTRTPPSKPEAELNLEGGEFGWRRLLGSVGTPFGDNDGVRADLNVTHTDGWRDGTNYDRQSADLRWDRFLGDGASLKTVLATSNIDQQTAGTSRLSLDDYLHHPTRNYYPISFREVHASRLSVAYEKEQADSLLSVTPYVRSNEMKYMPNWSLGYDPNITKTGHDSVGMLLKYRRDFEPMRTRVIAGVDLDYSPGRHEEYSINAVKDAAGIYSSYTFGPKIYDYDVTYRGISPYLHAETSFTDALRLTAGLRYDMARYEYDNKLGDGPIKVVPKPTSMSFSPTYNHPGDTSVDFSQPSPKLGLTYAINQNTSGFIAYSHAFRAPSEGDLFRPGSSRSSLDLSPVKADNYETGLRGKAAVLDYEVALYHMVKRDDLVTYKDPVTGEQYTVNAGETRHQGVEVTLGAPIADKWRVDASLSYAKHTYESWTTQGIDYGGKEMELAPRELGNVRLSWKPDFLNGGHAQLQWEHVGSYWLDAANTQKYGGHDLVNLRADYPVNQTFGLYVRAMNLLDERYATSGSVNRGALELVPGMPRTFFAGVTAKF